MATVAASARAEMNGQGWSYTWSPLTAANADGAPVPVPGRRGDTTVAIYGTFNTGSVAIQGTLATAEEILADTATWFPVTDPQGNAIAKTAAAIETITEACTHLRPLMSGAGTDSITVRIYGRGQ